MNILYRARMMGIALTLSILTGCASTAIEPFAAEPETWNSEAEIIVGLSFPEFPQPNAYFPGADCLLCLAAAKGANMSLTSQAKGFSTDALSELKNEVINEIEKRGAKVVVIEEPLEINKLPKRKTEDPKGTRKDFSSYKEKFNISHLLILNIGASGISRAYSSYIPTGEPFAFVNGSSVMINLEDQSYEWYMPFSERKAADGEWKEPPTFPGLTNAYYHAQEAAKERVLTVMEATEAEQSSDVASSQSLSADAAK